MDLPAAMRTATAISFQPTGAGQAAITGDFVLLAQEVNPVVEALRAHGIEVTAIHSHMLIEQPRLFYLHFWANDTATTLAQGLRAALDQTKTTPSQPERLYLLVQLGAHTAKAEGSRIHQGAHRSGSVTTVVQDNYGKKIHTIPSLHFLRFMIL